MPIDIEEFRKTDLMFVLSEKLRCIASMNVLIRAATYYTMRSQTVLPFHKTKTVEREKKKRRMVHIINNPVEDDICRLNPESY